MTTTKTIDIEVPKDYIKKLEEERKQYESDIRTTERIIREHESQLESLNNQLNMCMGAINAFNHMLNSVSKDK